MKKKGALELSMTTIIVVVIGITLLTLGLTFVRNIFSGIGESTAGVQEMSKKELSKLFEGDIEGIYLQKAQVSVKKGKTTTVPVILGNPDSDDINSYYELKFNEANPDTSVDKWFTHRATSSSNALKITSGNAKQDPLTIRVPTNAKIGEYIVYLDLDCGGCSHDGNSEVLTVKVTA
jgi:hypothetical protein